ncbi:sigma-70 family RNA polymerase sigma factor [Fodinicola acaciae]|uniref:sigma-70 family RNA polymerase sigma factor n=1 Tax=Fodinicola acaciae TaxID=2681555 RepID=UPI0013D3124F|nr:sigma-70 family RNA polymerase sigma factor [Fodinicola acaciae]
MIDEVTEMASGGLEGLFRGSYPRLVASMYALTGNLNEAQDAVQEAFARAVAIESRVLASDSPEAYLHTVARNVIRARWRRTKRHAERLELAAIDTADGTPSPDRVAVLDALAQLPLAQRETLVRFYFGDQSLEEIAWSLEVSVGTVKSRLARGRSALAALLDENIDESDLSAAAARVRTAAATTGPDLPAAYQRGRRRKLRRRLTGFAGGALAVAAALLLVFVIVPARPEVLTRPVALAGAHRVWQLGAVDVSSFYALVETADSRLAMARTVDAGRTWKAWGLPEGINVQRTVPPVLLSRDHLQLGDMLTTDGGHTWIRQPAPAAGPPLATVPAGWPLVPRCSGDVCRIGTADPATGKRYALANPGGTGDASMSMFRGSDGTLWQLVSGRYVATSDDEGRSWKTRDIAQYGAAAVSGPTAYVLQDDGIRQLRVIVSTNRGRDWIARGKVDAPLFPFSACAFPNGNLLVTQEPGVVDVANLAVSRDHGLTFDAVSRDFAAADLVQTADQQACLVRPSAAASMLYLLTTDGVRFTQIRSPLAP